MLESRDQESGSAAGGIKDGLGLLRVNHGDDEVNNMARSAELAGIALRAKHGKQVLKRVTEAFAVVVAEAINFLEEQVEGFGIAIRQEHTLKNIAEQLGDVLVFVHLLNAFSIEQQAFMPAITLIQQLRPAVFLEVAGEEGRLAAEFFGLAVHVIHEFIDQGDGDLFHLRLRVGTLPTRMSRAESILVLVWVSSMPVSYATNLFSET